MFKKEIVISDKKIEIFDDVFSYSEKSIFYVYALNSLYSISRSASGKPKDVKYGKTLACILSENDIKNFLFFKTNFMKNFISKSEFKLIRARINLCLHTDVYNYHTDSHDEECISFLYYINEEWKPEWEGETHFSLDGQDIDYSCNFKPGRIVVFNSTIPHKSSQPSTKAEENRYVLNILFASPKHENYENFFDLNN